MKKITETEIISKIKSEFSEIVVPDLASNIMAKYNLRPVAEKIETKKQRRSIFNLKYAMSLAMILVISVVVVLAVTATQNPVDDGSDPIITQTSNAMAIESISALYMFSEDSDVEPMDFGGPIGEGPGTGFMPPETPPVDDQEMAVRMHRFLVLSEQMIQNTNNITIEDLESDLVGYSYKEKVTIQTYLENAIEYVFYYNITKGTIEDDDYSFEGLINYNEKAYQVSGEKSVVSDKRMLNLVVRENALNWVEVEKDLDSTENDTEYKVYNNSQVAYEATMKFERVNDNTKLNFEYRKNQFIEEFIFEKAPLEEGKGMTVRHRANNQEKEVDVYIVDGQNTQQRRYEYRFGQNKKYQFDNPFGPKEMPSDGIQN
ncbi:MAG: hypothetical protein PHT83_02360 [Bacilli bacterium]|nr:hypothetical protein [Bacilli bacterium]